MNMNMPNRRAVVAGLSASAAVVAGFLRLKGEDDVDARRRRDRGRGRADVQGPCGENPEINKCSRNRDCCTEFCDREIKRCRYKALGETCTSDQQCRGSRRCIDDACTLPPTATPSGPTATPTATPTETPLPTATPTATPEVPRTWSNLTTVSTMVSGTNYGGRGLHLSNDGLTMYLTSVDLQGLTIWTRASTSTNT